MALTSTIFVFDIDLADDDRQVYESLSLRVARHPSESDEFLVARVLAYCLEYTEGIEFSRGLCDPAQPPVATRRSAARACGEALADAGGFRLEAEGYGRWSQDHRPSFLARTLL
jgi:YaeQ protein